LIAQFVQDDRAKGKRPGDPERFSICLAGL